MTQPFKIEASDINKLNQMQQTQLLKELLHAEAFRFGIEQRAVEVALNINVGDGGEDGRISWNNGPDSTDYIPNRLVLFQNKATDMGPTAYGNEILTEVGIVKPQVDEVLHKGGSYVVFTTQKLNTGQINARKKKIREALANLGKTYADTCDIHIYDASKTAGWVNCYIPSIVAVQSWAGRPVERGLKTFELWREHEELSRLPFIHVDSRKTLLEELKEGLVKPKTCFRIMGLSGLGKTRTAFQAFFEEELLRNLVVYIDANHAPTIDALVADWVSLGLNAILVVDNCEFRLHERLVKEIRRDNSQISLLSLDYNFDSISAPTISFKLNQMVNDELLQLLNPVYKDLLPDLDRIVSFAQGFPKMAVLLAEARLNEDPNIGVLTEDDLARKLLWKHNENENIEYLKILRACSLFDFFGVEKEAETQLQYIAELVGVDIDAVYECVKRFSERGLIDRRGRFGQVIPKPLAIMLAGQWWTNTREQKQRDLIDGIPESMVDSFCEQVEKMDFHPGVKLLTEKLCGPQGPFGQAEVILSSRGSRFFRAFVSVNPESTSDALYRTLKSLDHQQLLSITDDTRRNLVWGLEKLCFHADLFMEAAWSMLLLASAENETYGNNATGLFVQLFQVHLSGTEAEPRVRFALLKQAMDINQVEFDMVVIEALKQVINTYGGGRTVGAEYQGTKAPLQEWRPKIWQEIFEYWQEAFSLLLVMLERGDIQKEAAINEIGRSIRIFVSRGRIEMLDTAIKKVVDLNGKYWPAALESIKDTFEYDSEGLRDEAVNALNSWMELLSPDDSDLSEKLKIIVISPPWEHHKDEEDEHYIDVAGENAKEFAREIAQDVDSLFPHISLLLQGEQRQSFTFGRQLALEVINVNELLEITLDKLIVNGSTNISFILGIYRGIYEKDSASWQLYIDMLLSQEHKQLAVFYPEFIRTGIINKSHLVVLLDLIRNGVIATDSPYILNVGYDVTNQIDPETVADFCISLSMLDNNSAWTALNFIYSYCYKNKQRAELIRDSIKTLVIGVPLYEKQKTHSTDAYRWHTMAETLLSVPDQEFAIALANKLIITCQHGFAYGDLWHHIKPLLFDLMTEYGEILWPIFGMVIKQAKGMELYWLQSLFQRENNFSNEQPSVLSVLPTEDIIAWCTEYPGFGPAFVATCINVFEPGEYVKSPSPLFVAILENFGDDERVASAFSSNMTTRGWTGSLVPYLESDKAALTPLLDHGSGNVRRWVKEHISQIDRQIAYESSRDEERDFGHFFR